MKKWLFLVLVFMMTGAANAQFAPGQVLTAAQLNAQFAKNTTFSVGNLTLNYPLLGNGGGDIQPVASLGTSGMFFTSNGPSSPPSFQTPSSCVMVFPGVGIPNSSGSAWNASYGTTGTGTTVVLNGDPTIMGTTTNDDAVAGSWMEYPAPTDLSAVSMTSTTIAQLSSVSLTAGDYEITGVARFIPAGTTTVSSIAVGVSTSNSAFGAIGTAALLQATLATGSIQNQMAPVQRIKLASTTTVYLVGQVTFGVSTLTANGYMHIRRVR